MNYNWNGPSASNGATQLNGNLFNTNFYIGRTDNALSQAELDGLLLEEMRGGAKTPIIEELIKKGAEPTDAGSDGTTALHEAVLKRRVHAVELLLESDKINVNAVNKDGKTPLALAKTLPDDSKRKRIITMLREEGAMEISWIDPSLWNNIFGHEPEPVRRSISPSAPPSPILVPNPDFDSKCIHPSAMPPGWRPEPEYITEEELEVINHRKFGKRFWRKHG